MNANIEKCPLCGGKIDSSDLVLFSRCWTCEQKARAEKENARWAKATTAEKFLVVVHERGGDYYFIGGLISADNCNGGEVLRHQEWARGKMIYPATPRNDIDWRADIEDVAINNDLKIGRPFKIRRCATAAKLYTEQ